MNKKKVSLKDIAEKAQVSTALVSYVLNGKEKESRVGHEIAVKIKQIAKELNYQPNYLAKSLRSGKTQTIGLIIADISNPFFANIARIVEDEAKKNGYTVIIGSSDEKAEKSWDLITVFLNRQVDGFIIVSSENSEEQIQYLIEKNVAFVLLDRHFPTIPTHFVSLNSYKAAFDAGVHLIQGGYKNIGLIAYKSNLFHMQERIRGYRESLAENGIVFHPAWLKEVGFDTIDEEIKIGIDEMLASAFPVDALIFATYRLAVTGLKYINALGLKVPDDLAIVSFGQAEVFDLYYCPITYVLQPMEELGKTAVEILIHQLKEPHAEKRQILMEAQLMARDSSRSKAAIS
ncbi:LacI family DNA-binding transcriptional regulator [Larkinella punicea]|uniref:LacI family transcriptional regulator n=1 Tax=Larkinella punicea TaxID=2315727 RepID=A0A368JVH2_9BACT|nr:LacI family DNA-binding transcriptional regulator [Larkinella punicea]RCR70946.1 LacI family transcriptional regulator [Larkinella punicea]